MPVADEKCNRRNAAVLSGVDVVAFASAAWAYNASAPFGSRVTADAAVAGREEFAAKYLGYTFWFASQANRDLFEANPAAYAPAWGGFCAYGISGYDGKNYLRAETQLYTVPANVDRWANIDGALYMFRGEEAMELFLEEKDRNVAGGNQMWSSWFGSCAGYYNTQCFKEGTR